MFSGVSWNRDEPLTIQFLPRFAGDSGDIVTLDLKDGGATALSQGWWLRIDVISYDDRFDVTVLQPTLHGFVLTRSVAHEVSLPRAVRNVTPSSAGSTAGVTAEQRQAAQRRQQCERDVSSELRDAAAPVFELPRRFSSAEVEHRLFNTGPVSFADYRRRIERLVDTASGHRREAEAAQESVQELASQLAADGVTLWGPQMLQTVIDAHMELTDAWMDFRSALFNEQDRPDLTFQTIYPDEWLRVRLASDGLLSTTTIRRPGFNREVKAFAVATCAARYP